MSVCKNLEAERELGDTIVMKIRFQGFNRQSAPRYSHLNLPFYGRFSSVVHVSHRLNFQNLRCWLWIFLVSLFQIFLMKTPSLKSCYVFNQICPTFMQDKIKYSYCHWHNPRKNVINVCHAQGNLQFFFYAKPFYRSMRYSAH